MTTDIRVGDRFMIEVTVVRGGPETWRCAARGGEAPDIDLLTDELLAGKRLPRAIRVGDRVTSLYDRQMIGDVIALHKDKAWVEWESFPGPGTSNLVNLTLCDEASP